MRRTWLGVFGGVATALVLAAPVLAHGDHDARPLARDLAAGPYRVSLWRVYPDFGAAMTPHLIVLFDGAAPASGDAVGVEVNSRPVLVIPSTTTRNGWETTVGVADWDIVSVTVREGDRSWPLESVIVRPAPTSMLPMRELVAVAIVLTAVSALWAAGRTARAWRRPVAGAALEGEA